MDTDLIPELTELDRYVIRQILGKGAMGHVYAAWDPKLHREVAIKLVARGQRNNVKGQARFEREAQAIAAIRHPNVVQIYDYSGMASDDLYLVMEKLDGHDLFEKMRQSGMMPEAIAVAIGHELCGALEAAHNVGIIHRDLKPENVFLNSQGRVVLTDFGIVKAVQNNAAIEGYREKTEVIGTPGFMSPEHMRGRGLGPSVDLFALGALMYNIATLNMPFNGSSPAAVYEAAAHGYVPDPRQFQPNLSAEFVAVLNHCLTRDPRRRPKSAAMLKVALQGLLEDAGVVDLREDLRDFVADPVAFGHRDHRRQVSYLANGLKVAKQDNDAVSLVRLTRRLNELDPYHPLLQTENDPSSAPAKGKSGLLRTNVELLLSSNLHPNVPMLPKRPRLRALATVGLAIGMLTGGFALGNVAGESGHHAASPTSRLAALVLPPPTPTGHPALPQATAAVDVEVLIAQGEPNTVMMDGYPVPGGATHQESLNPGRHLLEVHAQGQVLKRWIAVAANEKLSLVADMAHHLIMVR